MSDLLNRANEIKKETEKLLIKQRDQQLIRDKEQKLLRDLSNKRAQEFIDLMRKYKIPTVDYYAPDKSKCQITYRGVEVNTKKFGKGWITKYSKDLGDWHYDEGFVLLEDGRTCLWRSSHVLKDSVIIKINKGRWLDARDDQLFILEPCVVAYDRIFYIEAPYANDKGFELLSRRLYELVINKQKIL
jgi:hypothetical protein